MSDAAAATQPSGRDARTLLASLLESFPLGKRLSTELSVIARRAQLSEDQARKALGVLEKAGLAEVRKPFAGRTMQAAQRVPYSELGLDLSKLREQERRALSMLKRMADYAYSKRCRREFILQYFGEERDSPECSGCDVCSGARLKKAPVAAAAAARGGAIDQTGLHSELAVEELRRFRRELSRDLAVPPFIIFNDATLYALATALPVGREEFLAVKGTGESRWERFGPKVVEICLLARAAGHPPRPAVRPMVRRRSARS